MTAPKEIRIATRESKLALWQAEHTAEKLRALYPETAVTLVPMTTKGDQLLGSPLAKIGGKGLFIKELENAMLDGRADIAVHSMKDVGAVLPEGFTLAAIMEREDATDAFVSSEFASLDALPNCAKVGTCSLRRRMQIARIRPDLQLIDLRGNLQTRLAKLDNGEFDAIILASAGLIRLGLESRIKARISKAQSLPAIGQGAIGIECLENSPLLPYLQALNHEPTAHCVRTERIINERLQGSCQVPLAAHAEITGSRTKIAVRLGTPDGITMLEFYGEQESVHAADLANQAADALLLQGAQEIINDVLRG